MPNVKKKVLKRTLKKKQGGRGLYGIKQGVGKVTRSAFPKQRRRRTKAPVTTKYALNAMHPCHLPLPRAVGGYTVVRTTDIINNQKEAMMIGCFKGPANEFTETCWLDTIAVTNAANGLETAINDVNGNAFFYSSSALGAGSLNGAKMVPAAITVQIMNGENLQQANGITYIGRSKTVLDLMGNSRTWKEVMDELVSYSAPRLCSGGKLSLRGVQVNAIPNNMSVLSDFVPRRLASTGKKKWAEDTFALDFEGFGPIFVYNPDKMDLKYLVTIEWRMRFDPLNPAYSGHVNHQPASESTWSKVIADAESAGNGVMDIADVTADIGMVAMMAGLV
jgi:hypothetical protein